MKAQAAYMADLLASLHYLSWPSPFALMMVLLTPSLNWPLTNWLLWLGLLAVVGMQLFQAWHLHFDARLFRSLAETNDDGRELDDFLLQLVNKASHNADFACRIAGSQQLIRHYLLWTLLMWLSLFTAHLMYSRIG